MNKYKPHHMLSRKYFYSIKDELDGFVFYKDKGDNVHVVQCCPNKHVKSLLISC